MTPPNLALFLLPMGKHLDKDNKAFMTLLFTVVLPHNYVALNNIVLVCLKFYGLKKRHLNKTICERSLNELFSSTPSNRPHKLAYAVYALINQKWFPFKLS